MMAPELTVEGQLVGWCILLGLIIAGLAFGAWREEQRRIDEEMKRRERIKGELRDGD